MLKTRTYTPPNPGDAVWIGSFGTIYKVPSEAQLLTREGPPDFPAVGALAARYGMELNFESVPRLLAQHRLSLG